MNAGIADPEVRKKKLNAERLGGAGGFFPAESGANAFVCMVRDDFIDLTYSVYCIVILYHVVW